MAKVKAKWIKRTVGSGLHHALREGQEATVCGVKVGSDWTQPGTPVKAGARKCAKCLSWEPDGIGPGGWAPSQRRKAPNG